MRKRPKRAKSYPFTAIIRLPQLTLHSVHSLLFGYMLNLALISDGLRSVADFQLMFVIN